MRLEPAPGRALVGLALALALLPASAQAAEPAAVEDAIDELRAPASEIERGDRERSLGTSFLRLRQEVDDVPVLGGEAVVSDAPRERGDLLVDDTRPNVERPPQPEVARSSAIERAREAAGVERLGGESEAELAILPGGEGGTLVWRVLLPAIEPVGEFEVLVDARDEAIVSVRDLLQRAQGQGKVFDPNPVVAQGGYDDLSDDADADTDRLTGLLTNVPLERLADRGDGQLCLAGQWSDVRLPAPSGGTREVCAAAGDFRTLPSDNALTRADDEFEAVMAYFHIDRAQQYVRQLGFPNVNARQIRVDADFDLDPAKPDNSYYRHFSRSIALGTGAVDDGEDAEVIVHEYGHAIQDSQAPGFGTGFMGDGGAMGEGFGDYLAAVMSSRGPGSAESHARFDPCIFEWDTWGSAFNQECLRRVDLDLTTADIGTGTECNGVHCMGQAWSGALWDLRAGLGKDAIDRSVMDRLVIQSHFYLTSSATFDDGARAIVAADRALYGGAHEGAIRNLFVQRGLLDPNVPRTLTIDYSKKSRAFKGRLTARLPECAASQVVTLYKRVSGPDRQLDRARTASDGRYRENERRRDGRFYARAAASTASGDNCLSARSPTLKLR